MTQLDDAIEKAGGVSALARLIGENQTTVSMWKRRGRIPPRKAKKIRDSLGIPLERLIPEVF